MTDAIHQVERLDFAVAPWRWPFPDERRAEIDAHFAALRARSPKIWNGRVLMMRERHLDGTLLRGRWFETGFADFIAWRDWGCPDPSVTNCFAMGALRGADGSFVLGVMGSHTVNAGRVYFAAGTPDPHDVVDGRLDLDGSVVREVREETGLTEADYIAAPAWRAVSVGQRLALIKVLAMTLPAEAVRARILATIASQNDPELAGVYIARSEADLCPMMPEFVKRFLADVWREESAAP